ncbi:DUF6383 domain-containing protein, partial [Parabacteroides sp.]
KNGFNYSFDAQTDLVGNAFAQPMKAYEYGADENSKKIYFVVGGKDDALEALDAEGGVTEKNLFNKDVKILALHNAAADKYTTTTTKSEAYKVLAVAGDKADDTNYSAGFTVKEFDKLANEGEFELEIANPANTSEKLYVGAIRYTASDAKTYVTTVKKDDKGKLIYATLGTSTYLDASVLLKEGKANYVNLYFTSNDQSQEDKTLTTEYHKYLVPTVGEGGFELSALAANEINFKSALAQWAVAGFDGKYTFTLVNRETAQKIVLKLQPSDVKGEYEITSATDGTSAIEFANLTANGKVESEDNASMLGLAGVTVKFISVEKASSFLDLTKEEMEAGVKIEFSGKNALVGEKTFYTNVAEIATDEDENEDENETTTTFVPVLKASKASKLEIARAKGKINEDDEKAVENYMFQEVTVASLKSGKVVTAKDTLFVPTYNIYVVKGEGDDAKKLFLGNDDQSFAEATESNPATAFYFRKNANGTYAMVAVDEDAQISANATAWNITAEASEAKGTFGEGVNAYGIADKDFAYVTVLVQDNSDKTSLEAVARHASFDNINGSINYQLNANGINEGVLGETMTFWLDTADSKAATPSFYISRGIVEEGAEAPAYRMFMYNATDSMSFFNEGDAVAEENPAYMLQRVDGEARAKVIFRKAEIAGIDTLKAVVDGKSAIIAKEENRAEEVLGGLNNFKFGIRLADEAVADEYIA